MVVSVLSLVYNHEEYLDAFFEGVLSQELSCQFEIVIGVDKSSDASLSLCQKYQQEYPAIIKLLVHENRVGIIGNFVATYNACKGKYIAICEGDDYWIDKQKIARQLDVLEKDSKAVLSFTNIKIFDEDEKKFHPNWALITKETYTIEDIIQSNYITTCSVLFRNKLVVLNERSFAGLSMADFPLYVQLLQYGYAKYLDLQTSVYRRNQKSSFAKKSIIEQLVKKKEAFEYLLNLPDLISQQKILFKAYHIILYAIASRLSKNDPGRRIILLKVFKNFNLNNKVMPLKALIKLVL